MGEFRLSQRAAAQRAEQRNSDGAAQGRTLDRQLYEQIEAERAAADPNYVKVPWTDNAFDPNYYVNASETYVSEKVEAKVGKNAQNSVILRQALLASGVPDPARWGYANQAHHIVETSNYYGRNILFWAGIDLNSSVNGVFLPTGTFDGINDFTTHLGSHVQDYTDSVNKALGELQNWAEIEEYDRPHREMAVVDLLNRIRRVLLTKVLPINSRIDPDYNPDTQEPISIMKIFDAAGLFMP